MKALIEPKIPQIITDENVFQERVAEITSATPYDDVKSCIKDIKAVMHAFPKISCLCAPQVGKNLRLFVVRLAKTEDDQFKSFLNPIAVKAEGLHLSREVSPSFPDKQFIIPRKNKIHIAYQTPDGHVSSETYTGPYGEVVQQMIEMLDGITLKDYGLDLDDVGGPKKFDRATQKDKVALLDMYLQRLSTMSTDLSKEIEASPDMKNINDTINFMTGMLVGDIKPVTEEEMQNIKNEGVKNENS